MICEMKKIIIPILAGFALLAASCEKYLEIPQKGVVSTIEYYASDEDAQAALVNMYGQYIENVGGTEGITGVVNSSMTRRTVRSTPLTSVTTSPSITPTW